MTSNPRCVDQNAKVIDVAIAMKKNNIGPLIVVDKNNHPVGIISQADIMTRLHDPAKAAEVVQEISK